ncbi:bifunctional metallophosphatase/5'-nucleotidase [Undibacterium sp.]|jgi:5'-nucleotidase|uniref:bifunctional metallophosphatase/5'-nucleotidase n=1 Tax=Undibacterium sp. TaxID=1914977 RepID=UPI002C6E0F36|nr:bifunctional metallophosphatase/5'-nucleotidase [Undibacterium sp.]HTD05431.1 bifunctional metallophosphatase/5'-nucleotidase [Undibacterium sp.]
MPPIKLLISLCALPLLVSCSTTAPVSGTTEITIFSINDFHGHVQSDHPVPYMAQQDDPAHPGQKISAPSGGFAYLATLLKERRRQAPASILVGAGDLIGASPAGSSMLKDEPVIEAMNQLGMEVSAVGNHEFDAGQQELSRKIKGECPSIGCKFPGFSGTRFSYIAANVLEKSTSQPWLKPYVIKQVGDVKVAFIGAVTTETPSIVSAVGIQNLQFIDEAQAINRYVPEIKRQNVAAIVVLIHEGANYPGAANDPSYRCDGLQGPIIDIANKLDPAINLVVSAHTHQAYTCKIGGKLVVSGRNYGSLLTEVKLKIDRVSNQVIDASAHNYAVDQRVLTPDPDAKKLVDQVAALTDKIRRRPIATLTTLLNRKHTEPYSDTSLGNVIADAQLSFARNTGAADISFMNSGGIRSDLQNLDVTFGDIYATQPFGNGVVRMNLSGAQIIKLLQQQWDGRPADNPKMMAVSHGFSYQWRADAPIAERVTEVRLNGQPIDAGRQYAVVVNGFMADGGDGYTVLKAGTQRQLLGGDVDAMEAYMVANGGKLSDVDMNRIKRLQ